MIFHQGKEESDSMRTELSDSQDQYSDSMSEKVGEPDSPSPLINTFELQLQRKMTRILHGHDVKEII